MTSLPFGRAACAFPVTARQDVPPFQGTTGKLVKSGAQRVPIGRRGTAAWMRGLIPARPLLDDKAWAKLCRALEQAAAGGRTTP